MERGRIPSFLGGAAASRVVTHAGLLVLAAVAGRLEQNSQLSPSTPPIRGSIETEGSLLPSQIAYGALVTETPAQQPAMPVATLTNVTKAMEYYRDSVFKDRDFEDIKMYLDIYQAAAARYNVDWRLLWIIHDKETICSRMIETTMTRQVADYDVNGNKIIENVLYGAMQRDKLSHPDSEVEEAIKGMEYLATTKTRAPDDWKEIVWAAKFLERVIKEEQGSIPDALRRYSAPGPAQQRARTFNLYKAAIPA